LQPKEVLVLLKHYFERGAGETLEPTPAGCRKNVNLMSGQGMETAIEPAAGIVKDDRLEGSQRWRVGLVPGLPKAIVACAVMKKEGQLANVMNDPIPKKEIAQDVKREVSKMVDGTQARKREPIDLSRRASLPKETSVRDMDV
jgi:hypothetical protein